MRPVRALGYTIGLCAAFALPSLLLARGFDPLAIGLVGCAFAVLVWIALIQRVFGGPLAALRLAQVLRVVIFARLLGAIVPCGCADLVSGGWIVSWVTNVDVTEGGPSGVPPQDFASTAMITLLQGAVLMIECVMMAAVAHLLVPHEQSKHNPDICHACGYDIRASRSIGRCPECGTACRPLPCASEGGRPSRSE